MRRCRSRREAVEASLGRAERGIGTEVKGLARHRGGSGRPAGSQLGLTMGNGTTVSLSCLRSVGRSMTLASSRSLQGSVSVKLETRDCHMAETHFVH